MSQDSGSSDLCSSDSADSGCSFYTAVDDLYLWEGNLLAYNLENGYGTNLKGGPTHDSTPSNSKRTVRSTLKSIFNLPRSPQPPAKCAVEDDSTAHSFPTATANILAIGEEARAYYEAVRSEHYHPEEDAQSNHIPFSSFSKQQMEAYFGAAIDANNALSLRRSVMAVEICNALENLLPKLSLYEQDGAVLSTLSGEITSLKKECQRKKFPLKFRLLEFLRGSWPTMRPSVLEQHGVLFYDIRQRLGRVNDAEQAVYQFMADPCSLLEHRIEFFCTHKDKC